MKRMGSIFSLITVVAAAVVLVPWFGTTADAYSTWSNCASCHGDFRSIYTSRHDGSAWNTSLHSGHFSTMLNRDCNTCHSTSPPAAPVSLSTSLGGTGFPAISCLGCHGRLENGPGGPGTVTGTGLRRHHTQAGVTTCTGCHPDASTTSFTPVPENVKPPYYFTPDTAHPNKPTDPCNDGIPGLGSSIGLDKNGNGLYGLNDPACAPPPLAGALQFSSASYSVNENGATATVTVTRTGGSFGVVSVSYATSNGTATAGSDYTPRSGTLSWANGETANKTFTIAIIDDTTYEGNETVNLALSSPTGGATLGTQSSAVLTIIENDPVPPSGSLQFSSAGYSVSENGGSVTITVTRTGGSFGAVSVSYATSNGTATAGSDYTPRSGTLSWANGETASKTFTIAIIDDTTYEGNETVNLALSSPTGGATLGTQNSAVLTIIENDPVPPSGSMQFSSAAYSVSENGGSVTVTVTRTGGSFGAVSVSYATSNGTATAGSDYTPRSGTLSWANGETASKTFTIGIINDAIVEGNETITLSLNNPSGGAALGNPSTALLTLVDDDGGMNPAITVNTLPDGPVTVDFAGGEYYTARQGIHGNEAGSPVVIGDPVYVGNNAASGAGGNAWTFRDGSTLVDAGFHWVDTNTANKWSISLTGDNTNPQTVSIYLEIGHPYGDAGEYLLTAGSTTTTITKSGTPHVTRYQVDVTFVGSITVEMKPKQTLAGSAFALAAILVQ